MSEIPSDDALWLSWTQGDAAAFEVLYRRLRGPLFAVCRALAAGSPVSPDDLFQETFRRAFRAAGAYQPRGALASWLSVISRNAFREMLRRKAWRSDSVLPEVAAPQAPEGASALELFDLLGTLPEEERAMIALRHLQGLPVPEVAALLGVSTATVKRGLARGLGILARKFENS